MTARLHVTPDQLRQLVGRHLDVAAVELRKLFDTLPHGDDAGRAVRELQLRAQGVRTGRVGLGHADLTPELAVPAVYGTTTAAGRWLDLVRLVSRDGEDVPLFRAPRWCAPWIADRIAERLARLLFDLDLVDGRPSCGVPTWVARELAAAVERAERGDS